MGRTLEREMAAVWVADTLGPDDLRSRAAEEVARLELLRRSASPEEYVRTFVGTVNRSLVFQAPSPLASPTQ